MEPSIGITRFAPEVTSLCQALAQAIRSSTDESIGKLAAEVPTGAHGEGGAAPLTLAFVGQYDAGKSTILKALTGREDIRIGADLTTDEIEEYDWNNVCVIDTPGIHAGRIDHDETSYKEMDRSDLIVFVITAELFDDLIGADFRRLAFAQNRAREMILLVNKMAEDPGTPETKTPDIAKVVTPLTPQDFRTVFIDARAFLEAQESPDPMDRAELLELSHFDELLHVLDGFIRDRGLMARLTTPLVEARRVARQAADLLSADLPEERAALELLHRKRSLLSESERRIRNDLRGRLAAAGGRIVDLGDELAVRIAPGETNETLQRMFSEAQTEGEKISAKFAETARELVESEIAQLESELGKLRDSRLAEALRGAGRSVTKIREGANDGERLPRGDLQVAVDKSLAQRLKSAESIATRIGELATTWAIGPRHVANPLAMKGASGSGAHRFVYDAGKFFGVKFKPWGAVRVARAIGTAGRCLSAVAGILGVIGQIAEDKMEDEQRRQLRDARDGVRRAFRDAVREMEDAFWVQFDKFSAAFYRHEAAAIDAQRDRITNRQSQRSNEARVFAGLGSRATTLIGAIQRETGGEQEV